MNIDELTLGQLKEIKNLLGEAPLKSAYEIGKNYQFRTVTHIITGRLVSIHPDGLVITDGAWVPNTGRYMEAVASGDYQEVEPYPEGQPVILNQQAMIDVTEIPTLPRKQK